ncbi:MAG: STAS-like domain-containing protein [Clostridium sp.]
MNIRVKDFLGEDFAVEDAILLREIIKENIEENITLDFDGIGKVSTTFLNCLFGDLINKVGRSEIFNTIDVKNLSNYNDYSRVVLGTTFGI